MQVRERRLIKRNPLESKKMFARCDFTERQQHARQPVCNTILVTENTWTGNEVTHRVLTLTPAVDFAFIPCGNVTIRHPPLSNPHECDDTFAVGQGLGPGTYQQKYFLLATLVLLSTSNPERDGPDVIWSSIPLWFKHSGTKIEQNKHWRDHL